MIKTIKIRLDQVVKDGVDLFIQYHIGKKHTNEVYISMDKFCPRKKYSYIRKRLDDCYKRLLGNGKDKTLLAELRHLKEENYKISNIKRHLKVYPYVTDNVDGILYIYTNLNLTKNNIEKIIQDISRRKCRFQWAKIKIGRKKKPQYFLL
jgi:hypothetical protein